MKTVLFVLGGGIGNIVQATPAIQATAKSGFVVDLLLHCNSSKDISEIFGIPEVRSVFTSPPKKKYDFQLSGPFTPGVKHPATKHITTRIHYAQHIPEAEVYYDLAKQIGVKQKMPNAKIAFGKGPEPAADTVAIYPGSKHNWAMKRWDKFDQLAAKFKSVAIVGSDKDIHSHGNPTWIHRSWEWPKNTKIVTGTLGEMAYFISKCKLFIGNDGGLSHVAAATGVPTFVIFGPSSAIKNKPYAKNAHVIALDMPCRPCQFKAGADGQQIFGADKADCPLHMQCMKDMSVDYVYQALNKIALV